MSTLRDAIAEKAKKAEKESREYTKYLAESKMFRKVALDLAKNININIYRELKDDDPVQAVHDKTAGTCMEYLQVATGYYEPEELFKPAGESKIFQEFFKYKNPDVILVLKVRGIGLMVVYMSDSGDISVGYPRVINYSRDSEDNLYVNTLEQFKNEFKM